MSTIEPTALLQTPDALVPTKRRHSIQRDVIESVVIGIVLTALSYIVGLQRDWIPKLDWLEVFAVFTSYSCTWLCVKERRINYPIGAISSVAYSILFWKVDLIASAVLNAYLAPYLAYGWFRWRKDEVTRPVTRIALKMLPLYLLIGVAGYLGAHLVVDAFNGTMAMADSLILAGTILAQVLLDNKKWETWIAWMVVNVLAIYTYSTNHLPLVAFQYIFFILKAFWGAYQWRESMHRPVGQSTDVTSPI